MEKREQPVCREEGCNLVCRGDRRSSVLSSTGGHAGEAQHKWRPEGGALLGCSKAL